MPFVYFIQEDKTDVFKIGITEKDVANRLRSIQTGNSRKLRLFATIETKKNAHLERKLHELFRDCKAHDEWFKIPPVDLKGCIDDFYGDKAECKIIFHVASDDLGKVPDAVKVPEPVIKTVYTAAPWKLFLFQANGLVLLLLVMFFILVVIVAGFITAPDSQKMLSDLFYPKP